MIYSEEIKKYIIYDDQAVSDLLKQQNEYKIKTFVLLNKNNEILGTVSDGDIRRYMIEKDKLPSSLLDIVEEKCFTMRENDDFDKKIMSFDIRRGIIPIRNSKNQLVDVYAGESKYQFANYRTAQHFTSIAPVRVTFAGGGTDIADWFKKFDGKCINAAINLYARVNFELRSDDNYKIFSVNKDKYNNLTKSELMLYQGSDIILNCLKKFPSLPGLNITVYCDYPIGSGLGGSSSLCVAVLKGCIKILNVVHTDSELRSLAYEVERYDAKLKGGWQDQIAAVSGGINISKFSSKGIINTKIFLNKQETEFFNNTLFLFPIGHSRSSSDIHKKLDQERNTQKFQKNMLKVRNLADELEKILLTKKFETSLGPILDKGWQIKRSLSSVISNLEIDEFYKKLISYGSSGGRLLGAGHSGYLMMLVDLKNQSDFLYNVHQEKINYQRISIDPHGARNIGIE